VHLVAEAFVDVGDSDDRVADVVDVELFRQLLGAAVQVAGHEVREVGALAIVAREALDGDVRSRVTHQHLRAEGVLLMHGAPSPETPVDEGAATD
jgi:hypothetical protein